MIYLKDLLNNLYDSSLAAKNAARDLRGEIEDWEAVLDGIEFLYISPKLGVIEGKLYYAGNLLSESSFATIVEVLGDFDLFLKTLADAINTQDSQNRMEIEKASAILKNLSH